MYKLAILTVVLAVCSATVLVPSALHYVAAPHPAKLTYVAAVAPVAPVVSYAHSTKIIHHAPALVHHAVPIVHHAPVYVHAPLHHSAKVVHQSTTFLAHKKA